jgi:hypothetical protein
MGQILYLSVKLSVSFEKNVYQEFPSINRMVESEDMRGIEDTEDILAFAYRKKAYRT